MTASRVVLVGPTASGKSAVALEAARRAARTEIVSIDAMAVYRGMDLGTAKPSAAEQEAVRHHLVDVLDPSEECTVAWFQAQAGAVLADLDERGVPSVLVGGTGLYVRAVVDALDVPGKWPEVRAELDAEADTAELHRRLVALDPAAAARMEPSNRRRAVRALEVTIGSGRPFSSFGPGLASYAPAPWPLLGMRLPRTLLDERIEQRFRAQLDAGLLDEVRTLARGPGQLSRTAAQALGYRELLDHVAGRATLADAVDTAIGRIRRFARRQERWFRRDPRIGWIDLPDGEPAPAITKVRNHLA
jgi:tRNA dimethylallyltransferase